MVAPVLSLTIEDDGYDIADYYAINPIYGTLADKAFLSEAHRRDLRDHRLVIITFGSSHLVRIPARNPGTRCAILRWVTPENAAKRGSSSAILSRQLDVDHVAKAYFWHRFSHQPDEL
jgi:hypothetical protein